MYKICWKTYQFMGLGSSESNFKNTFSLPLGTLCIAYDSTLSEYKITYDFAGEILNLINKTKTISIGTIIPEVDDKCISMPSLMKTVLSNSYVKKTLSFLGIGNIPQELCMIKDILAAIINVDLRAILNGLSSSGNLGSFKISLEGHAHIHFYMRKTGNAHCCSFYGWQKNSKNIQGKWYTGICRDWQLFSWYIRIWLVAGLQLCFSGSFMGLTTCRVFTGIDFDCKTWDTGKWGSSSTATWAKASYRDDHEYGNHVCSFGRYRRRLRRGRYHCRYYALGKGIARFQRDGNAAVTIPIVSIELCYWPTIDINCSSAGQAELGQMMMEVLSNIILAYLNSLMALGAAALGLNAPFYFECFGPVLHSDWGTRALKRCSAGMSDVLMFRLEVLTEGTNFKDEGEGWSGASFNSSVLRLDKNGNYKGKCITRTTNSFRMMYHSGGKTTRHTSGYMAGSRYHVDSHVFKCIDASCSNNGKYIGTSAWSAWLSTWNSWNRHAWASYDPVGWEAGK
jgi:hypothetical protein